MSDHSAFVERAAHIVGSYWPFMLALAATGPAFTYSATWQLINRHG